MLIKLRSPERSKKISEVERPVFRRRFHLGLSSDLRGIIRNWLFLFSKSMKAMPPERSYARVKKTNNQQEASKQLKETRPWSDLPHDLLRAIAEGLGLIDLLALRGVCKAWNSASSTSSAMVESLPNREPWFLLYGPGTPDCKLVTESLNKYYTITIPDFVGATCIASKEGWLLLFRKGSMFFFCPFTAAKISLPQFPQKVFYGGASFSSAPTSPDCVVCALCEINEDGKKKTECWELCRNATVWTMRDTTNSRLTPMIGAIYNDGSFYFCNDEDHVLKFDIRNGSLSRPYLIHYTTETKPGITYLPWRRRIVGTDGVKGVLGLAKELTVPTCGTLLPGNVNRVIMVPSEFPGECQSESENDCLKGVWIQPRFHQLDAEHRW